MYFNYQLSVNLPGLYRNFLKLSDEEIKEIPASHDSCFSVDLIYKPTIKVDIGKISAADLEKCAEIRALEFYLHHQNIDYFYNNLSADIPSFYYEIKENKVRVYKENFDATYLINDIVVRDNQLHVDMSKLKG